MSSKFRRKLLTKIAQAAGPAPTAGTTSAATPPVTAPAPQFSPITGSWAWIPQYYNAQTVGYLAYLLGILNTAMHYSTNGQYNLQKNQNDLGSLDTSGLPSTDAKNIVLLAKLFHATFLNHGKQPEQRITPTQINQWANTISSSQPLQNLAQLNQTGQLAQQLNANFKLDGSLRQNVINYLGYITQSNPVQQQAR
jgi:hypothetical protein